METMGWLIIFIVLIVIELLTMGLTTIWFAGGALAALLMSVLGFGMPVQVVVFIIVSVLLLVLTRPIAVKYFNQNRQKTNVESLIGQQALVLEDVDTLHASGQVKVNGQIWSAKTEEMSGFIAKDTVVMIQGIQGVKVDCKGKGGLVMVAGIFSMLGILILLIVIGVVVSCVQYCTAGTGISNRETRCLSGNMGGRTPF